MDKKITVLESGGILDFPASVKIDSSTTGQQQRQHILYITNFGFISAGKLLTPRVALPKAGLGSSN
jgi:hypothetical protein